MKVLTLAFLTILLTTFAFASENSQRQALQKCRHEAALFFQNHGPRSTDMRRGIQGKGKYIEAGTPIKNQFGKTVAQYDWDVLCYRGVGSEHSGWFEVAITINPYDCSVYGQFHVYSE